MVQKNANIEVYVQDWHLAKTFLGTEDEAHREAFDWMNEIILQYLDANSHTILDDADAEMIAENAYYCITFNEEDYICMYAVFEEDADEPVVGVYENLADAEETILAECESWVEECMNTADPMEVFGKPEWDFVDDYWLLMNEAAKIFGIQTVPAFGVEFKE